MVLYLSDFTAFLEIWVGTILLLLYRSFSLTNNNDNQGVNLFVHSTDQLSQMYNDFIQKYQGYFLNTSLPQNDVNTVINSNFSLDRITRRYRFIALTAIIYGLFILLYIGIEKKVPESNTFLIFTDVVVVLYLLLLTFVDSNRITYISVLGLVVTIVAYVFPFCFQHEIFTNISRSTVTIITLFTCCFFVLFVIYIRYSADQIQIHVMDNQIRKCDTDIQTLMRMTLNKSELQVDQLNRHLRKCYRRYIRDFSSNQPSKNEIIQNLILIRLHEFIMKFGAGPNQ